MFAFMLWVVVVLGLTYAAWRLFEDEDAVERMAAPFFVFLVAGLALFYPALWLCRATTGLLPDYSSGERIGYVTKVSHKGVWWKTWEVEVQLGTGDQAALQSPHRFCVRDPTVLRELQDHLGKQAVLHYCEWLLVPFAVGDASAEILRVEWRNLPVEE